MRAGLGQIDFLAGHLLRMDYVNENFDIDFEVLWDRLHGITETKRKSIWRSINSRDYQLLGQMLDTFGIPRRDKYK